MLKASSIFIIILSLTASACAEDFRQENTAANLQLLGKHLHKLIYDEKDNKQALSQFLKLIPDEIRLKAALREDVSPANRQLIISMYKNLGLPKEAEIGRLMKSSQVDVKVHAATTEEIAKYANGTVAYQEFPGGCKRVAELLLKPGMTFYEMEFLEPGNEAGMKYHLFYWDGKQWTMLGPVWRAIK